MERAGRELNMAYYDVKKIYPWLYSIRDPGDTFCYLAIGNDIAMLFDTTYGIGNLPDAIRKITDKPVVVVLGHGHHDHANGAFQFGEAWLHEADFDLCKNLAGEKSRQKIIDGIISKGRSLPEGFDTAAYLKAGTGNLKKLEIGRVFDLGGLHMEVIGMEGHTAGSVGLLAREHHVLLDSDAASSHVWMFLKEALPLSQYIAMLKRVVQLEFDTFFVGHSGEPKPKSDFAKYIKVAGNASPEKSKPYPIYPEFGGFLYKEDGAEIVFSKNKL